MEFGNSADSRIESSGGGPVRAWALNEVRDTKGNYFTVTYTEDNTLGVYYPNRIDYTANDSAIPALSAYNSIRFEYETADRPDPILSYQAGHKQELRKRLQFVKTYANVGTTDTLIHSYEIKYKTDASAL